MKKDASKFKFDDVEPMYDVIAPLRALALRDQDPALWKLFWNLMSHYDNWMKDPEWKASHQYIIDFLLDKLKVEYYHPLSLSLSISLLVLSLYLFSHGDTYFGPFLKLQSHFLICHSLKIWPNGSSWQSSESSTRTTSVSGSTTIRLMWITRRLALRSGSATHWSGFFHFHLFFIKLHYIFNSVIFIEIVIFNWKEDR